jgi:hypothetical protein
MRLADRYLAGVLRLLPSARREWGRAMRAELAALDDPAERRRFALSCTRVVLLPTARTRAAARSLAAAVGALAVLAGEVAAANAIGPAIPLALTLALLAWLGRRPGYLGPVQPELRARRLRTGGYVVVAASAIALVTGSGIVGSGARWGPVLALAVTVLAAAFLAFTARASQIGTTGLTVGAVAGLVAGAAGFAVLPFERIGEPLAHHLPAQGSWLALVVFGAPAAAALLTGLRTRQADQAVMAVLCAGALATLLVALAGLNAIVLFPDHVPNIVGPVMPAGTPLAVQHVANATEASDPYFGLLAFAGMLLSLLWVMARPPSRALVTVGLLCLLSVPPIAFAGTSRSFPGWQAITTATIAVAIAAVFTTRPAPEYALT